MHAMTTPRHIQVINYSFCFKLLKLSFSWSLFSTYLFFFYKIWVLVKLVELRHYVKIFITIYIPSQNNNSIKIQGIHLHFMFAVDIDFRNAAGFLGTEAEVTEAQYVVRKRGFV